MRVQVNARNRAIQFDAATGEKILFAGLREGFDLPYECGTGTCGTCKAKRISGDVIDLWPEAPGRKHLKAEQNEILMCQCVAQTELTLELTKFVSVTDPGSCVPGSRKGRISAIRPLTHDVLAMDVDLDSGCDFDAGQFVALEVPGLLGMRAYSMVNFAKDARQLQFVIKKKPGGGFSDWLTAADHMGTRVSIFGPLGKATFYPSLGKNILCIAGGSGIAGMMSILSRATRENYFEQFRGDVFFGVRTNKDAFYLSELAAFRTGRNTNLNITIALSDEAVSAELAASFPQLNFAQGMVHEIAKQGMAGKYSNVRAYLAGPPPLVDAAIRVLLLEAKLSADNIRYDKFS